MTTYRLSWEMVYMQDLRFFCNYDPAYYSNIKQTVPNSQIPDVHWKKVSKETSDPWDQYKTLKEWDLEDKEFVRNIKLEKMIVQPQWEEISEPPSESESIDPDSSR